MATHAQVHHRRLTVGQLKLYVALQLQAYYQQDWEVYDELESKIKHLEQDLAGSVDPN